MWVPLGVFVLGVLWVTHMSFSYAPAADKPSSTGTVYLLSPAGKVQLQDQATDFNQHGALSSWTNPDGSVSKTTAAILYVERKK